MSTRGKLGLSLQTPPETRKGKSTDSVTPRRSGKQENDIRYEIRTEELASDIRHSVHRTFGEKSRHSTTGVDHCRTIATAVLLSELQAVRSSRRIQQTMCKLVDQVVAYGSDI